MTALRFGRVQKTVALVPMALLSTAWTATLAGVTTGGAVAADPNPSLPDGTTIPAQAIEVPASVSAPGVSADGEALGIEGASTQQVVATASTNGIPAAALAAYQRGETVINAADAACHIPWQLIAAIGRIESDHGRYGGNTLDANGLARPGIFGIPLNGKRNTAVITDTDAGQYDNDTVYDRAVGPMQFIPSTWSVVGVDADGDARRNPQDIDDAALATAVYLCAGADDLATEAGQRAAVYRYNHSHSYVDLVLSVMARYLSGDYTSVPNSVTSAAWITPDPVAPTKAGTKGGGGQAAVAAPADEATQEAASPSAPTKPAPAPAPTKPAPQQPAPTTDPVQEAVKDPVKTVEDTVAEPAGALHETLTYAEAKAQCLASGISSLDVVVLADCMGL